MCCTVLLGMMPVVALVSYWLGLRASRKHDAEVAAGLVQVMKEYGAKPPPPPQEP